MESSAVSVPAALEGRDRHLTCGDEPVPCNLKSETDQEGNTTSYEYNGRYLRIKRTNAQHGIDGANGIHLWAFDDSGNLAAETDEEGRVTSHEYDRQNRLTADIRTYRIYGTGTSSTSQSRYSYDSAGNRVSVTDPLGNKTEIAYDEWNRAWKTINPLGFTSISEQDGAGNQTRTVDHRNNPRIWNRDQRGLVISAIDAEGNETGYSYDENGNQTAITYANNSRTEISYDAEDRKGLITEAKGSPEERTSGVVLYDKVGNPLQVRDGNNNLTTTAYNSLNLPATVTDALGNSSSTSYYRTGKVKSSTNRRGAITTTDYDKLWRVIKVTDPLNQTISTSYDNVGNPRLATDKRGITSETIYDDLHRPVEKRRNNQRLASLEYDANNNLIAETDANNNRTVHAYDQLNRKISSTWPAVSTGTGTTSSSQSLYGYDENNNLISETDEEGIITSHGYDRENRRTYTERAGEGTWHHFDKMGDLTAIVRPLGNTRSFEHDGLRRLTKAIDDSWGLSLSTRYEYDKGGNLLKQIDPLGSTTENSFDKLNRKISTTWPAAVTAGTGTSATSQSLYGYDSEGNLTAETDPKGQQISHSYDLLNRKTESRYPDTVISYSYDQNNNLLTANTSGTTSSSTTNSYDNFDRLQSSTQQGITVSYSYDLNGNRTSVATPSQSTGYSYDARNRVATATANSTTTSFDYFKDGKRKTISYPNNTTETWDYYQSNRVKTILTAKGGTTISQFDYSYDANGNRTSQIESGINRNKQTSYSFDSLDRMTGYSEDNGYQASYTYNGYNRATETETFYGGDRTSKTYSYDNANQLTTIETSQTDSGGSITSTSRIDYGYDLNGNTISRTVTDGTAGTGTSTTSQSLYSYDSRNKLITVSTDGSTLGQNSYNAQGYRIRQQQSDRGDITYLYDGTSVIEERSNSSLLAHYRYAGKLLSLLTPQGNQYYHLDALGSTTDLTDDQGDIKASYHLDPWGSIEETTGDSINRRIFTGKETDQNTGLINIGVRYYDPETARFITQDTYLGKQDEPPSLHRYLYAYSNPTVYVDLEGYESILPHMVDPNQNEASRKIFNRGPIMELLKKHPERFADELTSDEQVVLRNMEIINKRTKKYTVEDLSGRSILKAKKMFSKFDDPVQAYLNWSNRDLISQYAFLNSAPFKSFNEGVYDAAKVIDPVLGVGDAAHRAVAGKDFFGKAASRLEAINEIALMFSAYKAVKVGMEARASTVIKRADKVNYKEIDWDAVVPNKGKYKGQPRTDHVRLHNVDNSAKPDHGVFYGDGVEVTNQAWSRAQRLGLMPDANGTLTVPMNKVVGRSGGQAANTGQLFYKVEIKLVPGTNKIITSYPTN